MDTLTPAEQPTETMVEGHFNGNDSSWNYYRHQHLRTNTALDTSKLMATGATSQIWQYNQFDATYKTTKYDLVLFFICVKTNSVVVEFVVQSETAESISEAFRLGITVGAHYTS